eukprot:2910766-Heterocapsa_arctica.AAC.1
MQCINASRLLSVITPREDPWSLYYPCLTKEYGLGSLPEPSWIWMMRYWCSRINYTWPVNVT